MKKLTLTLTALSISWVSYTIEMDKKAANFKAENWKHYELLADAIFQYESSCDSMALNRKEQAFGGFQIRQCKLTDYNNLTGSNYTLKDCYNLQLSRKIFLFFAKGKSLEMAAKRWNGSGPMTITYWNNVQKILYKKIIKHNRRKMNVHPKTQEAYMLLHNGILALARAEQQGICVDLPYIVKKLKHIERKKLVLESDFKETNFYKEWYVVFGEKININSPKQLSYMLYNVKKLKPKKLTPSGQGSTDEDSLKALEISDLKFFEDKSRYKKITDVLKGFQREQVDGVIHPFYNLHTVRTFRSSSDSPNWQNIPKRDEEMNNICRSAIYPRKGHQLLESDYGQLEVRISACYNKDPVLVNDILKGDMHRDMAVEIFQMDSFDENNKAHKKILRQAAKNGFVFPQFYGDYYKNNVESIFEWIKLKEGKFKKGSGVEIDKGITIADHLISKGIKTSDDFAEHLKSVENRFWNERFKVYTKWKEKWYSNYLETGYIDLLTGFRCKGVMSRNDVINYPVQGAAFHCLLWSFIQLDKISREEKWDTKLIGQIHDSIILDVHPKELDHVKKTIYQVSCVSLPQTWKWITIPLEIDADICPIDGNWTQKEKLSLV